MELERSDDPRMIWAARELGIPLRSIEVVEENGR